MDPFRAFVMKQLQVAKINKEHREEFTDPEGLRIFQRAFTHPTYDDKDNYQALEFIGDGIIKGILSQYIPRRFPQLASGGTEYSKKGTGEGVLSKTRRFLEQRKTLSDFALKLGFWDHVRADEDTKAKLRKETLEDVFEAFTGALVEIVDQRVKRGLGYNYAYNYLEFSLDNMEIPISRETLDDPITRLNELYKANELAGGKPPLKWGDAAYKTVQLFVPKLEQRPTGAKRGDVFYSVKDKTPYVYDKDWVHVTKAPLIDLQPFPIDLPEGLTIEEERERKQGLWYAGAYGFPQLIGKGVPVEKTTPQKILDNPDQYGATIIGQGMHFKKADAKKLAASQAINFLAQRGVKR